MPTAHRRAMAFDYGTRQIGVAVGQTLTGSAEPLTNLRARDGVPDWNQLATFCFFSITERCFFSAVHIGKH